MEIHAQIDAAKFQKERERTNAGGWQLIA